MMAEDSSNHFGAVDETTKRLVGRCARVAWLKEQEEVAGGSPLKVKQRLLSVEMPSAMESSLSVVEVASQKERPGVKTPSRAEDAKNEERNGKSTEDESDGVTPTNDDRIGKALEDEKSPFEVEGET